MLVWERMESKTYVFFGIVGAGKGTQIELLKKHLQEKDPNRPIVYAYPGAEYRKLVSSENYTGGLTKGKLDRGELQPDSLTITMFMNVLINGMTSDCHVIADGYPRTIVQTEAFYEAMQFYKRDKVEIVVIDVSKEEVIKRMKLRGRTDDTDEGINRRFWEFENNVIPALEALKQKGYKVSKVNGEQTVEQVFEELKKTLEL